MSASTTKMPAEIIAADLMTPNPRFIHLENTLQDAATLMRGLDVGMLLVVDGDVVRGVVTDRDIAIRGCGYGMEPITTSVEDIMTLDVVHVRADAPVDSVLEAMMNERVRRVVVSGDEGALVGIVSLADIVGAFPDYLPVLSTLAHISQPFAADKEPMPEERRESMLGMAYPKGEYTTVPHVPPNNRPAAGRK